ncbi:MAG: Uma2 family endonuclease [Synechococcaceae cyanobacterium SM2_3_1]|nr:Uma2 family endonuclease [Synechococcaceae cyanobacterium SM2_3_1]
MTNQSAELRCRFGERSIVPDIAVFAWQRIPRQQEGRIVNVVSAAPDWVIEILSPEQRQMRVTKNILHGLQYETQMGWLVDPEEALVLVYRPDQPTELCEVMDLPLPVPDFAHGFRISLQEIFQFLCE